MKWAVIGACGKMGKGIALLALQVLNDQKEGFSLVLVDQNEEGFPSLRRYLKTEIERLGEKKINFLREKYASNAALISNKEMIEEYVSSAMNSLYFSTCVPSCARSQIIFEAIVEDFEAKVSLFQELDSICTKETLYFSNTSSIPLGKMNEQSGLKGRLIGLHFYNPPPVQKLVEIILPQGADKQAASIAKELCQKMKKEIIYSNDVPGFIGNGYFIDEIVFSCEKVEQLSKKMSLEEAVSFVDSVTRDYLLRPMGIFQLMEYVGIDVCKRIAHLMGQKIFLEKIEKVQRRDFSLKKAPYHWKELLADPQCQEKIAAHFKWVQNLENEAALLTWEYLEHLQKTAEKLCENKVAHSVEDVYRVLELGFHHLYKASDILLYNAVETKK